MTKPNRLGFIAVSVIFLTTAIFYTLPQILTHFGIPFPMWLFLIWGVISLLIVSQGNLPETPDNFLYFSFATTLSLLIAADLAGILITQSQIGSVTPIIIGLGVFIVVALVLFSFFRRSSP